MNVPKLPNAVQKLGNKKKVLIPAVIVLVLAGGFGVHGLNRHKARKAMAETDEPGGNDDCDKAESGGFYQRDRNR